MGIFTASFFFTLFAYNSRIAFLMMPGLKVFITSIMYCLFGIESGMYCRIILELGWLAIYFQTCLVESSKNFLDR
jgi:hypothetical protein